MPGLTTYSNHGLVERSKERSLEHCEYSIHTQELLGKPPAWILRWGGVVMLSIMVAIVALSWIVKYPDIVSAKVTITTPIPPASLVARQSGKLHWLKNSEDRQVTKNELIAVLDSPTSYTDVSALKDWLKHYNSHRDDLRFLSSLPQNLKLGDSQNQFALFQKQVNELLFFLELNPLPKKIAINQQKQLQLEAMLEKFQRQGAILQNENTLLDKNLLRFQALLQKNLVSANSVDEKQLTSLNNRRQQEQMSLEATRIRVELTNLSAELNDLRVADTNKREAFKLNLEEAYQALQTSLNQWEKNFLLVSPIDGKLVFSKYWGEHQFVNSGEEVVSIVPFEKQTILAKMKMPLENSGKVKKGQKILIKLAAYPYQEYGQIVSQINSISLIPRENLYTVEAILPSPLVTSYKKTLSFHQELQGQAEIVTEDMRLLERLFYQIRKVIKKTE
jgi:hypothetical protein